MDIFILEGKEMEMFRKFVSAPKAIAKEHMWKIGLWFQVVV